MAVPGSNPCHIPTKRKVTGMRGGQMLFLVVVQVHEAFADLATSSDRLSSRQIYVYPVLVHGK